MPRVHRLDRNCKCFRLRKVNQLFETFKKNPYLHAKPHESRLPLRIWLVLSPSLLLLSTLLLSQAFAQDNYSIQLSTERVTYGPGAEVKFFGEVIVAGKPVSSAHITYVVFAPTGAILANGALITSSSGAFNSEFVIPTKLARHVCSYASPQGIYRIVVSMQNGGQILTAETSVRADFSMPEFEFDNALLIQVMILVGLAIPSFSIGKKYLPGR